VNSAISGPAVVMLPSAKIEIESEEFRRIITKVVVIISELDRGYSLLGNRTGKLVAVYQFYYTRSRTPGKLDSHSR